MVKYPGGINKKIPTDLNNTSRNQVIYASRGMSLEEMVNQSNQFYLNNNLAVIHKKPTPIQVVKVDYPKRSAATITEAYYRHASTTDYNGIYLGKYIDFEVKETKNKTSFPLSNLPDHQQLHMRQCFDQGGIVFILIFFTFYNEIYLYPFEEFMKHVNNSKRKSISYDSIKSKGYLCPTGYSPMVDYLKALDAFLHQLNL